MLLRNARHERFAQALAAGKTADEAYQDAGYKPDRGNASRLTANDSIRRRVEEITTRVAEKAEWTAADRLKMLDQIAKAALDKDPRVAVSAISEANKMQGSYPPAKSEVGKPGDFEKMDADELRTSIADDLAALGSQNAAATVVGRTGKSAGKPGGLH